jgi:hypothetical protein
MCTERPLGANPQSPSCWRVSLVLKRWVNRHLGNCIPTANPYSMVIPVETIWRPEAVREIGSAPSRGVSNSSERGFSLASLS